ncbi:MAG: DNRLRE domain-containing protein [candidate division KSB1 bacterium]|nr:DNRLRE domain-containing protein [candidate division KSB1 bacterium]
MIKFNLPPQLSGQQILSAKIGFYVWNQQNYHPGDMLRIYCLNRDWDETHVTWTQATDSETWDTPGGDCRFDSLVAEIPHQAGSENWDHTFYPEADITSLVQQWTDGARANCGLMVMNGGDTQIGFKASEYNEHQRPYLDITYTEKTASHVDESKTPRQSILCSNYPNPFNPRTTLCFQVPREQLVDLSVYDMQGRKIRTLVAEKMMRGMHRVIFDAVDLPSGVYVFALKSAEQLVTGKMLLLK